jgi:hypothetical protein
MYQNKANNLKRQGQIFTLTNKNRNTCHNVLNSSSGTVTRLIGLLDPQYH